MFDVVEEYTNRNLNLGFGFRALLVVVYIGAIFRNWLLSDLILQHILQSKLFGRVIGRLCSKRDTIVNICEC